MSRPASLRSRGRSKLCPVFTQSQHIVPPWPTCAICTIPRIPRIVEADGRLTDGRGETVYFSDSIIVFTSNIGSEGLMGSASDPTSAPILNMSYDELAVYYDAAVRHHFINKLQRPELLGRLGAGIVVFDRLREGVVEPIIRKALKGTKRWANNRQMTPNYDDSAVEYIKNEAEINVAQGGRGVNNKVEQLVITPLSRFVFWEEPPPGSKILVKYDPQDGIAFTIV